MGEASFAEGLDKGKADSLSDLALYGSGVEKHDGWLVSGHRLISNHIWSPDGRALIVDKATGLGSNLFTAGWKMLVGE